MPLLEPKEITVTTLNGQERKYIISKFPAVSGREIVAGYPLSAIPKLNEYSANEAIMFKLMAYVGVQIRETGDPLLFTTRAVIDNHVPDWETLVKIEIAMMQYNTSFFQPGEISTFCATIVQKLMLSISPMLTPLLARLSEAVKQRSKN
jgi:hypothetical protein